MADAHLLDLVSQRLANPLDQRLVRLGQRLLMFTALFILEIAQLQIALGHRDKLLAIKFGQMAHQPLVDTLPQQQDFDPLLTQQLQVRALAGGGIVVGDDVVDLALLLLHPAHVLFETDARDIGVGMRRGKAQQLGDLLLVGVVLGWPLFEHIAEFSPEALILVAVLFGQLAQHA